jgi:endonuclease YncB( thermonuclease family)
MATVQRIIDADTFEVERWLTPSLHEMVIVRLLGRNAPEKGTAEGDAAVDWCRKHVAIGSVVTLLVQSDDDSDRDHFGRLLARIVREVPDGEGLSVRDYGDELASAGFDVPSTTRHIRKLHSSAALLVFALASLSFAGCKGPACAGPGCSAIYGHDMPKIGEVIHAAN